MKKHPNILLIISILICFTPIISYIIYLFPKMSEEYKILMSSGGIITAGGLSLANSIPESFKYSKLLKFSTRSFTILALITVVQKFISEIIILSFIIICCGILYFILFGIYKDLKRKKENGELATEIARSITENTK